MDVVEKEVNPLRLQFESETAPRTGLFAVDAKGFFLTDGENVYYGNGPSVRKIKLNEDGKFPYTQGLKTELKTVKEVFPVGKVKNMPKKEVAEFEKTIADQAKTIEENSKTIESLQTLIEQYKVQTANLQTQIVALQKQKDADGLGI